MAFLILPPPPSSPFFPQLMTLKVMVHVWKEMYSRGGHGYLRNRMWTSKQVSTGCADIEFPNLVAAYEKGKKDIH